MNLLLRLRKAHRRHKAWVVTFRRSWYVDLLGSLVLGLLSYLLALWIRWGGDVPSHLWQQIPYAAAAGLVGVFVGGSLVDLWDRQRSWLAISYGAFVTSTLSVLFAMASAYAFRVVAIPRLTFAMALVILWVGLACWKWAVLRVTRAGSSGLADGSSRAGNGHREIRVAELAELLQGARTLKDGLVIRPNARDLLLASSRFFEDGDRLLLEIRPRACQWPAPILKRVADVVLSVVGLVVLAPLWIVAAVAIRLDSPGPILFRQTRVGHGGRRFEILKFRTMVDRAEDRTGPVLASRDDPRVTRVGRWLRAFRIDEIPQLVNVLRGEMSLVGPRPERPEFVEEFRKKIEGYDLRHLVKPGITGLAQIRGNYDTPAEDKLRFDLAYIFLWSPLLDLKIMLQTIGTMLTPERARSSRPVAEPPPARASETPHFGSAFQEVAASQDGALEREGGSLTTSRKAAGEREEDL